MKIRQRILPAALLCLAAALVTRAQINDATKQLARDIFQQLIEINTTDSVGSTTAAAAAMQKRLHDAGFSDADMFLGGARDRKGNLVARIHGSGARKPILMIGHLDVVEARRDDWSTDPFQFIEKDGYFYGRGTLDMKSGDAMLVTTMMRLKREHYQPDRDIIVALTADEEGGTANGVDWLLRNHRDLIDADYILNPDGGSFEMENGRRLLVAVQASEKLYQDFVLQVTNKGGHSSLPVADNAIYHLADGLGRLERYKFPFELSEVTRAYFTKMSGIVGGSTGADMKAILETPPAEEALARLAAMPFYNGITHITCVATRLDAGHANNALPQTAKAIVNCRILPGHTSDEVRATLAKVLDDPQISVTPIVGLGNGRSNAPSPLRPDLMSALEKVSAQMWPGVPVVPVMETGASDGAYTRAAGMPTYGVSGVWMDVNDDRSHGRDERILVSSFYEGVDFYYRFVKALSSPQ
jgi:acetylornithine deacetylase/succinyl-diaminopimelate desuccinylase-like protein